MGITQFPYGKSDSTCSYHRALKDKIIDTKYPCRNAMNSITAWTKHDDNSGGMNHWAVSRCLIITSLYSFNQWQIDLRNETEHENKFNLYHVKPFNIKILFEINIQNLFHLCHIRLVTYKLAINILSDVPVCICKYRTRTHTHICTYICIYIYVCVCVCVCVCSSKLNKGLPRQAEMTQGVPGRLRPRIFFTFRHYKGGRSSA